MSRFIFLLSFLLIFFNSKAQNIEKPEIENKGYLSIETAPPYWVLTLKNGFAFSACVSYKFKDNPNFRIGILGYSGNWQNSEARDFLLTDDFLGDNWEVQWNGMGIETHYIFNLGLEKGGLLTGFRYQWNNLDFKQNDVKKGTVNHLMITPQIGFQWFPFKKSNLYILPWFGFQQDVLGTDEIIIDGALTDTRKSNPIITFQLGWEFKI